MYQEEYLPQDNAYDYDAEDEEISISVSSEDDSKVIVSKFNTQKKKQADVGYFKQKVVVEGEIKKVESFASMLNCNAKIRHAISGHRTFDRVGSTNDSLYFSVTDTTGPGNEPRRLYYNTPEEYERHYHNTITVPTEIKEAWHIRKLMIKNKNNNKNM
jgi:hypothetical protein